jgi:hypothetical protein
VLLLFGEARANSLDGVSFVIVREDWAELFHHRRA